MTVTESGYYIDGNGELNDSDPIINSEVNGVNKASIYAYLRAGLNKRRVDDAGPISVLCCDNLRANGELLKRNFLAYLELCGDRELIDWLSRNASFPSSMVDRITPRPDERTFYEVARLLGRENDPSVLTEDFVQWVLEDNFAAEKPPLDEAGVQIVDSVEPYEETKIRVLNGGHTCLAYLGALHGHQTFDQAINDNALGEHFFAYENDEVLAALSQDLPFDKHDYLAVTAARFRNPFVADALKRICMDGVSKFPIYILPTVVGNFKQGRLPRKAIVSIASWYVFAKRIHDGDLEFDYVEPNMALLEPLLADGRVSDFAKAKTLWGDLPRDFTEFSTALRREIEILDSKYPAGSYGSNFNETKGELG
jgi:D-arabinitol 4-dehydrogenase